MSIPPEKIVFVKQIGQFSRQNIKEPGSSIIERERYKRALNEMEELKKRKQERMLVKRQRAISFSSSSFSSPSFSPSFSSSSSFPSKRPIVSPEVQSRRDLRFEQLKSRREEKGEGRIGDEKSSKLGEKRRNFDFDYREHARQLYENKKRIEQSNMLAPPVSSSSSSSSFTPVSSFSFSPPVSSFSSSSSDDAAEDRKEIARKYYQDWKQLKEQTRSTTTTTTTTPTTSSLATLVDKERTGDLFSKKKSIFKTILLQQQSSEYSPFSIASFLGKRSREEFEEENEKLSSLLLLKSDKPSDKVLFSEMNSIPFEIKDVEDLQNQIELVFDIPKKSQALFFAENGLPITISTTLTATTPTIPVSKWEKNTIVLLLIRGNYVFFDYKGNTVMVKVDLKKDTIKDVQEKIIDKIKKSRWIPISPEFKIEIKLNKIYLKSDRLFLGKEEEKEEGGVKEGVKSTIASLEQRRRAQLEELKTKRLEEQTRKRREENKFVKDPKGLADVLYNIPRGVESLAETDEKEYWKSQYNALVDSIFTAKTSTSRVILPCGHYAQRNTVRLDGTIECPVCENVFDFNTQAHPFACPCCKSFFY